MIGPPTEPPNWFRLSGDLGTVGALPASAMMLPSALRCESK